ncbi:hypothetical protein BASA81_002622 [Batrachochytrium salamandrivorans]|nr:hypothetical protein BASA81_002622 [Batrachochytrium salamandrivorans]
MLSGLLSQGQSLIELMDQQGLGQSELQVFFSILGLNADLEELSIFDCGVGDISALAMAKLLKTHTQSALTNVHMGSNLITDVGALALAEALETNTVVAKLGMVRCQLTQRCTHAFMKMLQTNVTINELWLHDNDIPNQVFSNVYYISTQIPLRRNFQAIVALVSVCEGAEYLPMEILQIVKDLLIGKPLSVQVGESEEEEEDREESYESE